MLSIALAMLLLIVKKLLKPTFVKLSSALSTAFEQRLFPQGDAFHRLRIGK